MAGGNLPEDMVISILLMLPVKSLLRFRCVSKTWCALIKNPRFRAMHLDRLTHLIGNDCIFVLRYLQHDRKNVLSFLSYEGDTPPDVLADIEIPFFENKPLRLLGPCNGIVCLTGNDESIVLCNPAIREFQALPPPRFTDPSGFTSRTSSIGFGFDPNTNDYKVVRIVNMWHDEYHLSYVTAEIYNLITNSWRQIDTTLPFVWGGYPCLEVLFNGAFHWFAAGQELILSFHMSNEVFQRIEMPSICSFDYHMFRGLGVLNESLALTTTQAEKYFDIWVMKEYGVKESWTKQFTIGPLSGVQWPLSFWKNDEELLLESSDGQLVSCVLNTQKIKEIKIYGFQSSLRAVVYKENFVSIKRGSELGSQSGNLAS